MSSEDAVELTVRGTEPRDAGRGVVRLPGRARRNIGVLSGDTVGIEGRSATVAKVWPAGDDVADDELRIDGTTRANAGVRVGDSVTVRPINVRDATRLVVTPVEGDLDPERAGEGINQAVKRALFDHPVRTGERVRVDALGEAGVFRVTEVEPEQPVVVTESTTVDIVDESVVETSASPNSQEHRGVGVTYEDVGGLGDELEQVRELVELPLADPDVFRRLGIDPPKGVLLHGPPGTGKTRIAKAVANEADASFESVSGPELTSKYKGETEEQLRTVFERARENAPSVIFFDEVDAIAGDREESGDMESRVVAQLLSLMDGLESRGEVVVIGATNRVDAVDPALRRPGRFDREVEVGVPDRQGRREILDIHIRGTPLAEDVDLEALADRTHGFVGADLYALVTEAGMRALRRLRDADEEFSETEATVTQADFEQAFAAVDPSAMRAVVAELPDTSFDDIGGLAAAKEALREAVEWPLTRRDYFEAAGIDPPTGVLLYGPPGTGKTTLARAAAHESGVNVISVRGPELLDKYVGESEKAVREVFQRARQAAPAIVFFDEIDAIATTRGSSGEVGERVVSQLLTELDRASDDPNLVILAATNRKPALDPALLRPGRLEKHVHVPSPDADARREILRVHANGKPLADDVDLADIASTLDGRTGADIASVVREAGMRAVRRTAEAGDPPESIELTTSDFEDAIADLESGSTEH